VLFEADQRRIEAADVLLERITAAEPPVPEYTRQLVHGVITQQAHIDELISSYAQGWALDRMPAVDRALLRLSIWELLFNPEVPPAVAIDEAVRLAGALSTDDSPAYINGVLARVLELRPEPAE
jgi:N utilization substance protein B